LGLPGARLRLRREAAVTGSSVGSKQEVRQRYQAKRGSIEP